MSSEDYIKELKSLRVYLESGLSRVDTLLERAESKEVQPKPIDDLQTKYKKYFFKKQLKAE